MKINTRGGENPAPLTGAAAEANAAARAGKHGRQNLTARRGHTTAFVVKGKDYFVARLDVGGVRVGMVGGVCFDIPAGHAYEARLLECNNEREAEDYFDELASLNP